MEPKIPLEDVITELLQTSQKNLEHIKTLDTELHRCMDIQTDLLWVISKLKDTLKRTLKHV